MSKHNEAIRLAAKEVFDFIDGVTDVGKLNKRLYDAALATLRPLLDQARSGVGDELPCAYWTRYGDGSGRIFEDKEDAEYFVRRSFTKDIEIVPVYTRALTQADQPADKPPMEMRITNEWLRKRIENDPDLECEAGGKPADKDDRREALAAFERVKKFADISTKGVSVFLIDEKKYLNKDLDVIHRALSGADGRG